jgi:phosphoglycolate phosphatase-like HAD superfamily hydrolase
VGRPSVRQGITVFWDVDDTLVDTFDAKVRAFSEGLGIATSQRASVEQIHKDFPGLTRRNKIQQILIQQGTKMDPHQSLDELEKDVSRALLKQLNDLRPVPGAMDTLAKLRENRTLVALSAMPCRDLDPLLAMCHLASFFDHIEGNVGDKAQWVADFLEGNRGCVVGDSRNDLAAAMHNRLPFIQVALHGQASFPESFACVPDLMEGSVVIERALRASRTSRHVIHL